MEIIIKVWIKVQKSGTNCQSPEKPVTIIYDHNWGGGGGATTVFYELASLMGLNLVTI